MEKSVTHFFLLSYYKIQYAQSGKRIHFKCTVAQNNYKVGAQDPAPSWGRTRHAVTPWELFPLTPSPSHHLEASRSFLTRHDTYSMTWVDHPSLNMLQEVGHSGCSQFSAAVNSPPPIFVNSSNNILGANLCWGAISRPKSTRISRLLIHRCNLTSNRQDGSGGPPAE